MNDRATLLLTALAPMIWGSSYIVATEFLPGVNPLWTAALRALPAALLLLLVVRQLPGREWWGRIFILGALNIGLFWALLFLAAYRLPGGVAATIMAIQPLLVIFIARAALGARILPVSVLAALMGFAGVALLVLGPNAGWDGLGVAAAAGGALSMAAGTVLARRWRPDVSLTTFTAWQLGAGGIQLLVLALVFAPALPVIDAPGFWALTYLSVPGAAITFLFWFHGVARLEPARVSSLGLLSPLMAVMLGWVFLQQSLDLQQMAGVALTLVSVWASQNAGRLPVLFKLFQTSPNKRI